MASTSSTLKLDHAIDIAVPPQITDSLSNEDILSLQVRAFLEAAEDVDIERETLEELMQTLEDCDAGKDTDGPIALELDVDDHDDESDHDASADELDISSLYRIEREGILPGHLHIASPELKTCSEILFTSSGRNVDEAGGQADAPLLERTRSAITFHRHRW